MTDALRLIDESVQKLARAEARHAHYFIRSPVSGIVSGLSVHAPGQVVAAGQEIVRVVPSAGNLEIEVYLPNKDIGFVSEGQEASIKLDAFPFTEYGVLGARVMRISRDAIPEPEARQIESDGYRGDGRMPAGGQRMQNLVYSVILDVTDGGKEGRLRLAPGMAVTAEIKTGQRRVIEYLLSPLKANVSDALRER